MNRVLLFISFFCFYFLLSCLQLTAQVHGVSASKLSAICVEPVSPRALEFEPSFGYSHAAYKWDHVGTKMSISSGTDSMEISSGMAFRLTYGVTDGLEIGLLLPTDASQYSVGAKYKFYQSDGISLGGVLGSTIRSGNGVVNKELWQDDNAVTMAGGFIMSKNIGEQVGMDFNIQYQQNYHNGAYKQVFVNTDIGYFYKEFYQFIVGIYYQHLFDENELLSQDLVTLNPGITIESSENYLIVANIPIDIWGRNNIKSSGFGLAFTITFE